jgi:hypothetical protein
MSAYYFCIYEIMLQGRVARKPKFSRNIHNHYYNEKPTIGYCFKGV